MRVGIVGAEFTPDMGGVAVHGNDLRRPYYCVVQPDLRCLPGARFWSDAFLKHLRPLFNRRASQLVRESLARAPHVIANSRFRERVLLEVIPECRVLTSVGFVRVGAHFFDVEWQPATDAVPRLLTVSRLPEPRKSIDQVLRALGRLRDRYGIRYTTVGGGQDRGRLEALAGELGLGGRVRFTGLVSKDELLGNHAHSDLMVLTSAVIPGSHEGFGIVYLEAAASGVQSLAARVGSAAEAVDEGKSGM